MTLEQSLIDLGLSENEAKIYLTGIELGPTTIMELSKNSGVKRTTIYTVIESLQKLNLMQIQPYGWKKLFVAQNPENLSMILDKRKQTLESIIPRINKLNKEYKEKNEISYWEGLVAIRQLYLNILDLIEEGDDYLVIANQQAWLDLDPVFFKSFMINRAAKKPKIRMIFTDSEVARIDQLNHKKYNSQIRLFPPDFKITTNIIVTPKLAVINQLLSTPTAIAITNQSIIQTHRETFELLWKTCV